ncbi:MAG: HAD family hydrolase [Terriglobales bacterium]
MNSAGSILACIFDLDDTLYDCLGQRVPAAHLHAAEAMVAAGVAATVEQVLASRIAAFRRDPRLGQIDAEVCREFGVRDPGKVMRAAYEAYFSAPVGPLTLFPETLRVLRTLQGRGVRNFVVTFGRPETQHQKVRALGLEEECSIEEIRYVGLGGEAGTGTKKAVFGEILRQAGMPADRVLVVGDRPSGEIRAARELGMRTVRMRHGEFAALEAECEGERADFEIVEIGDLLRLPLQFGARPFGES